MHVADGRSLGYKINESPTMQTTKFYLDHLNNRVSYTRINIRCALGFEPCNSIPPLLMHRLGLSATRHQNRSWVEIHPFRVPKFKVQPHISFVGHDKQFGWSLFGQW